MYCIAAWLPSAKFCGPNLKVVTRKYHSPSIFTAFYESHLSTGMPGTRSENLKIPENISSQREVGDNDETNKLDEKSRFKI